MGYRVVAAVAAMMILAQSCAYAAGNPHLRQQLLKRVRCERKSYEGDTITVHYRGVLPDGTVFSDTYASQEPYTFKLGAGEVIEGWERGLTDMCEGEIKRLSLPHHLAYGRDGAGGVVPPNTDVMFEVELLRINPGPNEPPPPHKIDLGKAAEEAIKKEAQH
eukprot:TRINITY_DN3668_c0_g1_i1.p1 TRINITY_DN3668_c0_g1~~TRINITY_DN3668_c0_g1_i1.p1  ORF type:complete len:177 (-),score=54.73 TRINITY_DN3668_c0_g1_i1:41-526(-)